MGEWAGSKWRGNGWRRVRSGRSMTIIDTAYRYGRSETVTTDDMGSSNLSSLLLSLRPARLLVQSHTAQPSSSSTAIAYGSTVHPIYLSKIPCAHSNRPSPTVRVYIFSRTPPNPGPRFAHPLFIPPFHLINTTQGLLPAVLEKSTYSSSPSTSSLVTGRTYPTGTPVKNSPCPSSYSSSNASACSPPP